MTDKVQKIREEVERIQLYTQSEVLKRVLEYIDEVQKEPVSEDLQEAAMMHFKDIMEHKVKTGLETANMTSFKAGAKWQQEKEYTCYEEAFEDGAKWENEQLMAKAIDGNITFDYYGNDNKTYGCIAHDSFCLEEFGLKDRDKVKMILIKEG